MFKLGVRKSTISKDSDGYQYSSQKCESVYIHIVFVWGEGSWDGHIALTTSFLSARKNGGGTEQASGRDGNYQCVVEDEDNLIL